MLNPFRYGEVVTGEFFTDRAREQQELKDDIRQAQSVVIISPRRFGKTSLIQQIRPALEQDDVLVAYLDLFRTPSKGHFVDRLADAIYTGLAAPFDRFVQRAVTIFQNLPLAPRVTLNQDGTPSFEFAAVDRPRDLDRTIEQLLALPQEVARARQRRTALILDEFQQIIEIDPNLPALMRAVFQLQPDVSHVFLGSRRHLLREVFLGVNQPLYRLAKPMNLGPIPPEEFAPFIHRQFASTGLTVASNTVERILEITGGHPHDTQELCHFAWTIGHAAGGVTPAIVDQALKRVLDAENSRLGERWERLSPNQRLLITALVAEPTTSIFAEGYRRRHRLGAASAVQKSVERLVADDIIEPVAPGHYAITDTFLRLWVDRLERRR